MVFSKDGYLIEPYDNYLWRPLIISASAFVVIGILFGCLGWSIKRKSKKKKAKDAEKSVTTEEKSICEDKNMKYTKTSSDIGNTGRNQNLSGRKNAFLSKIEENYSSHTVDSAGFR